MNEDRNDRTEVLGEEQRPRSEATMLPCARLGPWQLLQAIGSGGMGEVFLGRRDDGSYDQQVAIKLLRLDRGDPVSLSRFRAERQILARLDHPNIARLIDGGTSDSGWPYLVMEHIEGERITDWCAQRRLGLRPRLELMKKICAAVEHAHQQLIVHRDLKPSNIMVTAEGEPKLLDFGVAKLLGGADPEQTGTGLHVLTPAYASPEQLTGTGISTRTDVYQLGLLLYELLSGARAQRSSFTTRPSELEREIVLSTPTRPSQIPRNDQTRNSLRFKQRALRGDLDNIVLKALRKEPLRRYFSVAEFSADINNYLQRRPVRARPDSRGYRLLRFAQRNALALTVTALMLVALGSGVVYERGLRWQAEQARDRAELLAQEARSARIAAQHAAEEAQRAQRESEREQATTEAVLSFIEGMLERASPAHLGRDLKVVDLLEDAQQRALLLDDEPAVQAALIGSLARTLAALGQPQPSRDLLRQGLALADQQLPLGHLGRIHLRQGLSAVLRSLDEVQTLPALADEIHEESRQAYGEDDPRTLMALSSRVGALQMQGRNEEALREIDALIERIEAALGEESIELAQVLNQKAVLAYNLKLDELAIATFKREYALRAKLEGSEARAALNALGMPIAIANTFGRHQQALDELPAFEAALMAALGGETPSLFYSSNQRLLAHWRLGQLQPALEAARATEEIAVKAFGETHPSTLLTRFNRAQVLAHSGQLDAAWELMSAVLQSRTDVLGERSPHTQLSRMHLALIAALRDDHRRAEQLFTEVRKLFASTPADAVWSHLPMQIELLDGYRLALAGDLPRGQQQMQSALVLADAILGSREQTTREMARLTRLVLSQTGDLQALRELDSRYPDVQRGDYLNLE